MPTASTDLRLSRRAVCAGLATLPALRPPALATSPPPLLTARKASVQLAPPGYGATPVWSYDGTLPGPVIRARQGSRLERQLVNDLPVPTSVHWHGIRIDNAMDGVAGLPQDPVAPGGQFDYAFDLPDAGTYWYHAHTNSMEQVARGLAGALIVYEPTPPEMVDGQLILAPAQRVDLIVDVTAEAGTTAGLLSGTEADGWRLLAEVAVTGRAARTPREMPVPYRSIPA